MGVSLSLIRSLNGDLSYQGDLPTEMSFSTRYLEAGGIPSVLADKAAWEARIAAGDGDPDELAELQAKVDGLNLTPMFERDGQDLIYHFVTGDVRYRWLGFDRHPDGSVNYSNQLFTTEA